MSYSRHMMQSVEIQNVVSIRASDDYQPGNDQDCFIINQLVGYLFKIFIFDSLNEDTVSGILD